MDCKDSDLDSVCSSFSQVSFNGETVSADQAIDESMKDIQTGTNQAHVAVRNMLTSDERGEDYEVMKAQFDEIDGIVKEAIELWKNLRAIAKQLVPPKPRATKKDTKPTGVLDCCSTGV